MQTNLYLQGPGRDALVISGGGASRVFRHQGTGVFGIKGLEIANGFYHAASAAKGGCIESNGTAWILDSAIDDCKVQGDAGHIFGGGVFADGVLVQYSTISGNQVVGPTDDNLVGGGGVASGTKGVAAEFSSIVDNSVSAGPDSAGGGIYSLEVNGFGLYLYSSTVAGNNAPYGGAIFASGSGSAAIYLSTISGNASLSSAIQDTAPNMIIANSTIAFNHAANSNGTALSVFGQNIAMYSSIAADNTAGSGNVASDVLISPGATWLGSDNLVTAAVPAAPAGVVTSSADPQLQPLRLNGGFTATHELSPTSPAVNAGGNPRPFPFDQRGIGYPRSTEANQTVDIGAVQFDTIFAGFFE